MIKKLSLKFVLVSLVLVVSVIITSSCYASPSSVALFDSDYTIEDIKNSSVFINWYNSHKSMCGNSDSNWKFFIYKLNNSTNEYIYAYRQTLGSSVYFDDNAYFGVVPTDFSYLQLYNSDGTKVLSNKCAYYLIVYDTLTGEFSSSQSTSGVSYSGTVGYFSSSTTLYVSTTSDIGMNAYGLKYEPVIAPDTSFDYSFEGIKRGQVNLEISNLNESLRMYGYVGLDTTFAVGDTLDITSNTVNLRLLSSKSDNSDLNCYLNEGEELNYYIVDENNIILDTGYISEMANGYFLYGFNVNNGVDFVFLKDGQVYWSNDLDFSYKFNNSEVFEDDDIVSMAQSSYIVSDKTVASIDYIGYVYDSNNNLLCEATCNFLNDLSGISISVDTTYTEQNIGWNKIKSCYWLKSINLDGTNIDGTSIDFSNYYVKWSVPTWLNLYSIEFNGEEYTKRNGIINGFSSNGLSGMFNLKIYELIKNHIKAFDIKLEVYDSDDNLVLTHTINSDDIIRDKVVSDENNVDKDDYDILDNPNYTGGSSTTPDINNIQNWTSDDYLNLMSTDNFVWEFFKAILGNLPWWITVPLTILIFGVVIITLIRFARGA